MAKEKFSSRESVVFMVQHYETLLVQTGMLESDQPFIAEALAEIARIKEASGNRCYLTRRLTDELLSRDLLNEEDIELEEEKEDDDSGQE